MVRAHSPRRCQVTNERQKTSRTCTSGTRGNAARSHPHAHTQMTMPLHETTQSIRVVCRAAAAALARGGEKACRTSKDVANTATPGPRKQGTSPS
uniref:Uncharacterized protein n=1 Tax=Mesocestoides corti TaxID=53468 RepID=A0A5K3FMX7_MESCO